MKKNGAEIVIDALNKNHVRFVIGIPGTHNIELYDALCDAPDIQTVLVTDEQSAGFMADGIARHSGELAAINLVPGAGLTHALSGIAECYMDQIPLLVLLAGVRQDIAFSYQLHDIDQLSIVRPVAKKVFEARTHQQLGEMIHKACGIARTAPSGPVVVEIPANLFLSCGESILAGEGFGQEVPDSIGTRVDEKKLSAIITELQQCGRVALYVGLGCKNASPYLPELCDKLDAMVFTSISGKGVFPETHPRWMWNTLGEASPPSIQKLFNTVNCLVAIGCRFGEVATASYGITMPPVLIHVDIDESVFNRNFSATHTLKCDATYFVQALLCAPEFAARKPAQKPNRTLTDAIKIAHAEIQAELQCDLKAHVAPEGTVSPSSLFSSLRECFGPDAVYVTDSGNGTFLAMENLRLDKPCSFLAPVDYSCMGYSIPAAIGAKLGTPKQPVIALVGDGALLMTGLEMITAVSNQLGIVFVVLSDGELSQIAQFQRASLNRTFSTTLFPIDLGKFSESLGLHYLRAGHDRDLTEVLQKARTIVDANKPVMVEVAIDYSRSTYFSKGVTKTVFNRLPLKDRLRLAARFIKRKTLGVKVP